MIIDEWKIATTHMQDDVACIEHMSSFLWKEDSRNLVSGWSVVLMSIHRRICDDKNCNIR